MNELALFAGAGGGILGGRILGWRTVCAVEIDPYARRVLLARFIEPSQMVSQCGSDGTAEVATLCLRTEYAAMPCTRHKSQLR